MKQSVWFQHVPDNVHWETGLMVVSPRKVDEHLAGHFGVVQASYGQTLSCWNCILFFCCSKGNRICWTIFWAYTPLFNVLSTNTKSQEDLWRKIRHTNGVCVCCEHILFASPVYVWHTNDYHTCLKSKAPFPSLKMQNPIRFMWFSLSLSRLKLKYSLHWYDDSSLSQIYLWFQSHVLILNADI